jgi:hypothetical protein
MPTAQTVLIPLPERELKNLPVTVINWMRMLQNLAPLNEVDTSAGSYSEAVPPPGLNATTGQSAQNRELTYKKMSADANTYTLTGAADGTLTLTAQYSFFKIKSDGTRWVRSG